MTAYMEIPTPIGVMLAIADDSGLCMLEFVDDETSAARIARATKRLGSAPVAQTSAVLQQTASELADYFTGTLRTFSVPLSPPGTAFQQTAWGMLSTIPYGTTRSYGEQARIIGQPTATRAVARANGDNPIAIIIPCHRIIGANGSLTGYGGGLWRKQWLLDHENGGALWPVA